MSVKPITEYDKGEGNRKNREGGGNEGGPEKVMRKEGRQEGSKRDSRREEGTGD